MKGLVKRLKLPMYVTIQICATAFPQVNNRVGLGNQDHSKNDERGR